MSRAGREEAVEAAVAARARASLPSERRIRRLHRFAGVGGAGVALTAVVVLVGWMFEVERLTRLSPGPEGMKFNTACCLGVLGATLLVLARAAEDSRPRPLVTVPLAGTALLAAATLVEYATGQSLGIDDPFGLDAQTSSADPGRMAPLTCVGLLSLALAQIVSARKGPVRWAQGLALAAIALGLLALVGYVFGVQSLYQLGLFNAVPLQTATVMVLAGFAVLALRPDEGFVMVAVGNTAGGVVVRQLLPVVVLLPAAAGALALQGLRRGYFDDEFAFAALVTVTVLGSAALVGTQAARLRHLDLRRAGAEDAWRAATEALRERDEMATSRYAAEQRTRRIIATSADAYIAIDLTGEVTDLNTAAERMFGWTRGEAVGTSLTRLIVPPDQVPQHVAGLARFRETGTGPILGRPVEVTGMRKDGHRLPVELTVWADRDLDADQVHAFVRDITDRKAAENELREANADLAEFVSIAAHDLRNPLAVISMAADRLAIAIRGEVSGPNAAELTARIQSAAERGLSLLTDLLAYSSIGRQPPAFGPVDLAVLIRDAADDILRASPRNATLSVAPLPRVDGDEVLLRQLVTNLVGNSLKYVPHDREPQITVDAVTPAGNGQLVIRFTDNGEAIPAEQRGRIFDMFARGPDTGAITGTGVGLAICRRVAERHGGSIWLEDAPERGVRFCLGLPASRQPG